MVRSAGAFGIELPPLDSIRAEWRAALRPDHWLRYTVTAGGNRVLAIAPIPRERVGAPVSCARLRWTPPPGTPGFAKHGSRAAWVLASRARGVSEVLFVDERGFLTEANRSNVIAAVGGRLVTPPLDGRFLPGVTRGAMLDAARAAGIPLDEAPVPADTDFDELYLSSTLKEFAPVTQLDGAPGPGAGPLGAALYEAFRALVARECADRSGDR